MAKLTKKSATLSRLKSQQKREANVAHEKEKAGRAAGIAWVRNDATLAQLRLLAGCVPRNPEQFVFAYARSDDSDEFLDSSSSATPDEDDEIAELMSALIGSPDNARRNPAYACGVLQGALEAWDEMEPELNDDVP